ncbi:response regulator [Mitsuaria sp. TWR114]|uniref:response regulator n=1 Tax=Mitsuaria sp. TWR114 TaxID=2601731 RepID=UPI0011BF92E2|nr:response regulator [Mitsuaria sp. TWR114]
MPASLRITIVVNHFDTRCSLSKFLRSLGHLVDETRSAADGLRSLHASEPETLICDIDLPDASGWDVMRQADLTSAVFAVAISTWDEPADRARSRTVGFKRHMQKPLVLNDIESMLAEASAWRDLHGSVGAPPTH